MIVLEVMKKLIIFFHLTEFTHWNLKGGILYSEDADIILQRRSLELEDKGLIDNDQSCLKHLVIVLLI